MSSKSRRLGSLSSREGAPRSRHQCCRRQQGGRPWPCSLWASSSLDAADARPRTSSTEARRRTRDGSLRRVDPHGRRFTAEVGARKACPHPDLSRRREGKEGPSPDLSEGEKCPHPGPSAKNGRKK